MPLPSLVAVVGTAALERAAEAFGRNVLRRWSDYRAKQFIEQFVAELSLDAGSGESVNKHLDELLQDEGKSAALFDAFRHVFLSASREIGPRVLAVHMAEVVAGKVDDPEISDAVMLAASTLLDVEFSDFIAYAVGAGVEAASFADSSATVVVVKHDVIALDSNYRSARQTTGPINLRAELGSWAQKLQMIGLLVQDISENEDEYYVDAERDVDMPGTIRRVHRNIELREGTAHLLRLAQRVRVEGR